jgi:alginate O-acetyltransferase complex protein AlgI
LSDVYSGRPAVRSPLTFAAFATFFPTQIAGPIKRYEEFVPQLDSPAPHDWAMTGAGVRLIVIGLFKKVALADNLAPVVLHGFQRTAAGDVVLGRLDTWGVVLAFALQIYFDFSGYTDIGRGSALLLGFRVPENFVRPYFARNASDFWRRWHISLSTWLRDYLYIPLGGNRSHRVRNLLITMVLGGLWHGASWTFIVWGAWHGAFLALYWAIRPWWRARMAADRHIPGAIAAVAGWALTFLLVLVGWVFFRAADLAQAVTILHVMVGRYVTPTASLTAGERFTVLIIATGCFAVEGIQEWHARVPAEGTLRARRDFILWQQRLQPAGLVCLFALTLLAKPSVGPRFFYFQF